MFYLSLSSNLKTINYISHPDFTENSYVGSSDFNIYYILIDKMCLVKIVNVLCLYFKHFL